MINYQQFALDNGMTVLVMDDGSTPLVSVNTLVGVGARDEDEHRTGFAHLFEHLMFGGTSRVPDYDKVVTEMGGESNAFTNNDYTNFYLTVPKQFVETALWLESDRLQGLNINAKTLAVQQSVVTEEYNYRYINQPYGDVWLLLRPLCYKKHPYRWCTIGADIRHVQEATLDDVRAFFDNYYNPANAVLSVAGNLSGVDVRKLVDKWYGDIESRPVLRKQLPEESPVEAPRQMTVYRNVPSDAIHIAYHTVGRTDNDFPSTDLISDVLSNGNSSRLYNRLVKERRMFSELDAYVTGDADPGLFVVSGKLCDGVGCDEARQAIEAELDDLVVNGVSEADLEKVKNKFESTFGYSHYKALDCAMSLSYYHWLNRGDWVNNEPCVYRAVTASDIQRVAGSLFDKWGQSVLYYKRSGGE